MELTGKQYEQLQQALIAAYPKVEALRRMVRFRLNQNLDAIAMGGNLNSIVFNLVETSQAQGWTAQLIVMARESNPGNPKLLAFAQEVGLAPTTQATHNMNVIELRIQLNQFDDVELETFCMNNFRKVYDKFSRGLRRDEKMNLLLDYCHRKPNGYQQLIAALEEQNA